MIVRTYDRKVGELTSQAYYNWASAGRPVSGLARPMARLRDRLRGYGYTVYDIGNDDHLTADFPEDHTPFSASGWPVPTPPWWLFAIDVMPPGPGLPSLAQLAAQIRRDKMAGDPAAAWLKYMNWEPGDGTCWHDSWQPGYTRSASSDRGHIHISGRSDMANYTGGDAYDPVARIRGEGADMYEQYDRDRVNATWSTVTQLAKDVAVANAADATRDAAAAAAIKALGDALAAGGGSVDSAAVIAAVRAEADATRDLVEQVHQAEAEELRERIGVLTAKLAEAQRAGAAALDGA